MDLRLASKIYARLLAEAVSTSNLAVLVDEGSQQKRAVIYNITQLMKFASEGGDFDDPEAAVDAGVVEGYIMIEKPKDPCNRAWEVKFTAGPGLGKIVYGIGYALSPSGALISDRSSVSSAAVGGWSKAFSSDRPKKPLDDMSHPAPGSDRFHDAHHTEDDASDDCKPSRQSIELLNYSYHAEGWEKPMLNSLKAAHVGVRKMLAEINRELPRTVTWTLFAAANHFFDMSYGAGE